MPEKLTPKQQRFVEEYMVDLNATRAYIRAGYKASEEAARRNAARLLTKDDVISAVNSMRSSLSETTGRTVAAVMADIRRIGDRAEESEDWAPALKARELEAKHLGAFAERVELTGAGGGPVQSVSLTPDEFRALAIEMTRRI